MVVTEWLEGAQWDQIESGMKHLGTRHHRPRQGKRRLVRRSQEGGGADDGGGTRNMVAASVSVNSYTGVALEIAIAYVERGVTARSARGARAKVGDAKGGGHSSLEGASVATEKKKGQGRRKGDGAQVEAGGSGNLGNKNRETEGERGSLLPAKKITCDLRTEELCVQKNAGHTKQRSQRGKKERNAQKTTKCADRGAPTQKECTVAKKDRKENDGQKNKKKKTQTSSRGGKTK